MALPNTLPGKGRSQKVRTDYAKRCRGAHGERLLKHLAHVARHGFNLTVWQWEGHTSPVSGHSPGSMHYERYPDGTGKAFDAYGTVIDMEAYGRWVDRHAPQVDEGIHNPGLSRKNGKSVPPSFWGSSTWSAHVNHDHVGNDGPAG